MMIFTDPTPGKRGRRPKHTQKLKPTGHTEEQDRILLSLAEDRGVSKAQVERELLADYLEQFGYSKEEQGLKDEDD